MTLAQQLFFPDPSRQNMQDNCALGSLNILLVEDSVGDALLAKKALQSAISSGLTLRVVDTLETALRTLDDQSFDVILLDLSLPDSSGFEGLISLQNLAPKLPIIILTAYADENVALQAVRFGAQDYLFKDKLDGYTIKRAIQFAVQRKRFEEILIQRANFDPLTGLVNRSLFENRLDIAVARQMRSHLGVGVFLLDLDRFKQVNDTLGHAAGDVLLQQVATRLKASVRPYDTVARFGGDEFALLIDGIQQLSDCTAIAEKITQLISAPFELGEQHVEIGISIGIATNLADPTLTRRMMMKTADEAMYAAKFGKR